MTTTYFVCLWHHDRSNQPVELYSELDEERMELRKVEVFKDGHGDVAGPKTEAGTTMLGESAVPALEEIATNPEFEPREITKEEFEEVWVRYLK